MANSGDELRRSRERMGLSLDEVASRTRIPLKWLQALESGDASAFPPGPFLAGYSKQYRGFLGVGAGSPPSDAKLGAPAPVREPLPWTPAESQPVANTTRPEPEEPTNTLTSPRLREQRMVRMVSIGAAVAAAVVATAWAAQHFRGQAAGELGEAPDQVVLITSASGVSAHVLADGRDVHAGALPPGKQVKFAAHDRLEIELEALDGVTLVYNGSTLKPLGLQSRSRRLVFVDDAGG